MRNLRTRRWFVELGRRVWVVAFIVARANGVAAVSDTAGLTETDTLYTIDPVGSIVLQPDGRILVASGRDPVRGTVAVLDGPTRAFGRVQGGIFRFHSNGLLDSSFVCRLGRPNDHLIRSDDVYRVDIALQPDARILAERNPTTSDLPDDDELVRLWPDGTLDTSFKVAATTNEAPVLWADKSVPRRVALGSDGTILWCRTAQAGIKHFTVSGSWHGPGFAAYRLSSSGEQLHFLPQYRGAVAASFADGGLTLSRFNNRDYNPPIEELYGTDDAIDAVKGSFLGLPLELCRYAVRLPDGGAVVAVVHGFRSTGWGPGRFLRFNKDWQVDWSYTNHFEAQYHNDLRLAVDQEGRLLVAGQLRTLNGEPFHGLKRLTADGATDPSFQAHFAGGFGRTRIAAITVQPNGQIVVGGVFTELNGAPAFNLVRLQFDGSLDESFSRHFVSDLQIHAEAGRARMLVDRLPTSPPEARRQPPIGADPIAEAAQPAEMTETISIQLTWSGERAEIELRGTPGRTYVLQAANLLSKPSWISVATNTADANGVARVQDGAAQTYPMRFYRVFTGP